MRVRKAGKKVYGAVFTVEEQRAMDMEIERQLAEWNLKNARELASMSIWILHEEFGFGPERLKRFFMAFHKNIDELNARYRPDKGEDDLDSKFLCSLKVKEYGIDLDAWEREVLP